MDRRQTFKEGERQQAQFLAATDSRRCEAPGSSQKGEGQATADASQQHGSKRLLNPHPLRHRNVNGVFLQPFPVAGAWESIDLLCPTVAADGHDKIIEPHVVHIAPGWADPQSNHCRRALEELAVFQDELHIALIPKDELMQL